MPNGIPTENMSTANQPAVRATQTALAPEDSHYIDVLRGFSIMRVMLGHLGLLWFFPPYSQYVGIFFPVLFFVSGAVSENSYTKAAAKWKFFFKRLISILVPYYVFLAVLFLLSFLHSHNMQLGGTEIFRWLVVWPDRSGLIWPIGQIWFISALLIMHCVSFPVLAMQERSKFTAPLIILLILAAALIGSYGQLRDPFVAGVSAVLPGLGHHVWAVFILFSTYVFGIYYFRSGIDKSSLFLRGGTLLFLILACTTFFLDETTGNLKPHIKVRSFYFMTLAFFAIFFLLAFRAWIVTLLRKLPGLESLFLYANRHSYGIFLLHTVVLFYMEQLFGWQDLSDNVGLALLRLLIVSALTLVLAAPFTTISKRINARVLSLLKLKQESH